jgi:uncharacterized membrane protein YraQ (UPF0718 family)
MEIGIARAVGAVLFSIVIGAIMHFIYRKEEGEKSAPRCTFPNMKRQDRYGRMWCISPQWSLF